MTKLKLQAHLGGLVDGEGALSSAVLVLHVTDEKGGPVSGLKKNHIQVWDASGGTGLVDVGSCTDLGTVPDYSGLKGVYQVPIVNPTGFALGNFVLAVKVRMPLASDIHKTTEAQTLVWFVK